jgi:hypothetical protein
VSSYKEQSNAAKAVRRGLAEVKPGQGNKKKPRVKGRWKVIGSVLGRECIFHHCATEELANKMKNKHFHPEKYRVEHRPDHTGKESS